MALPATKQVSDYERLRQARTQVGAEALMNSLLKQSGVDTGYWQNRIDESGHDRAFDEFLFQMSGRQKPQDLGVIEVQPAGRQPVSEERFAPLPEVTVPATPPEVSFVEPEAPAWPRPVTEPERPLDLRRAGERAFGGAVENWRSFAQSHPRRVNRMMRDMLHLPSREDAVELIEAGKWDELKDLGTRGLFPNRAELGDWYVDAKLKTLQAQGKRGQAAAKLLHRLTADPKYSNVRRADFPTFEIISQEWVAEHPTAAILPLAITAPTERLAYDATHPETWPGMAVMLLAGHYVIAPAMKGGFAWLAKQGWATQERRGLGYLLRKVATRLKSKKMPLTQKVIRTIEDFDPRDVDPRVYQAYKKMPSKARRAAWKAAMAGKPVRILVPRGVAKAPAAPIVTPAPVPTGPIAPEMSLALRGEAGIRVPPVVTPLAPEVPGEIVPTAGPPAEMPVAVPDLPAEGLAPGVPVGGLEVFMSPGDVEAPTASEKSFSGREDYLKIKGSPGESIAGTSATEADLPETLYHVTSRGDQIRSRGVLKGSAGMAEGGLGGFGGGKAAWFTKSIDDARNIQSAMRNAISISKGDLKIDDLPSMARNDEELAGLSKGTLDKAVKAAQQNYETNLSNKLIKRDERGIRELFLDTYRFYLLMRESTGGWRDPLIIGRPESFENLTAETVEILEVSRSKLFQSGALVRHKTSATDFLNEVAVHGDVPLGEVLPPAPTEILPPAPEIAPTVEPQVPAAPEIAPTPEEAVTPAVEAPVEPVAPITQPVPGEYAEHEGKSTQQFIDESPPIGLGVRQVVPPGVEIIKEPKDLVGLRAMVGSWVAPARVLIRDNPIANRLIHMGRDTLSGLADQQFQYDDRVNKAYKGLNKQEAEDVVDYLESPVGAEKVPDKLRPAFTEMNQMRREAREIIRDDIGIAVEKWGMSPEEYWPHIWVGSHEIVVETTGPKGQPIWKHIDGGFARGLHEAVDKAAAYLADNPDDNIRIKPRGFDTDYSATLLSRKGFWRFIGEVKKATELDKDEILSMMRGVAAIKPRGKFVGNFKQRETNLGGYMKGPMAFKIYMNRVLRKKWIDPFRKEATELATALPPGLRKYFTEYIDDIAGKYDPYDRKFTVSRNLSRITRAQSVLKLGFRPITAFVNRLQPLQIAFPEIGHYLFRGMVFKRTAAGKALIEESGIRGEVPKYAAGEAAYRVRPTEAIYKPLGLFSQAEMANREDVIAGGYLFARKIFQMPRRTAFAVGDEVTVPTMIKGKMTGLPGTVAGISEGSATVTLADGSTVKSTLDDLDWQKPSGRGLTAERMGYDYILGYLNTYGDPHKAALEYAKDLNADVNFIYNAADLPKMFRTQAGRVAFQFKTYPINFLATTMKWTLQRPDNPHYYARLGRLIAINTGLAGVRTVPYVGRKMWKALVLAPLLIPLIGEENRDRVKRVLGRGFLTMLGVDLSQRLGPNEFLPRKTRDLLGPLASDIYSFYRFVQDDWDWKQLTRAVPLVRDIYRALAETEYIADPNKRFRKVAEATGWDKALQAAGIPLEKITVTRDMQFIFNEMEREYKRKKGQYVDAVVGKLLDDESPIEDIRDAFAEGIPLDTRDFVDELIRKGTPQLIRELKTMPKPLRPEAIQMLQKVNRVHKILQTERKKAGLPPPQKPPTRVPYELLNP